MNEDEIRGRILRLQELKKDLEARYQKKKVEAQKELSELGGELKTCRNQIAGLEALLPPPAPSDGAKANEPAEEVAGG